MGRGQGSSKKGNNLTGGNLTGGNLTGGNLTGGKGVETRSKASTDKSEVLISELQEYVSSLHKDVDMLEGELEANGLENPNRQNMTYYKKLNRSGTEEEQIASLNEFIDSLFKDVDMLEGELESNGLENPNESTMTYYKKRPRKKDMLKVDRPL